MYTEIKLISKDTDLSTLDIVKYKWDVVLGGKPYQVVRIKDYVHTIGGVNGYNDLWCYPRDEDMSYDNLIQYNLDEPVLWGIVYEPTNYIDYTYDNGEMKTGYNVYITRNGEKFYQVSGKGLLYALDKAKMIINEFKEHPVGFNSYDWSESIIYRKVFFRSQPGIITNFYQDVGIVVIYPDFGENEVNKFKKPVEFRNSENDLYEDEEYITTSIFDKNIWWWRDN